MGADDSWVPTGIDTGKANIARVYDWWLGGDHNFLADQDLARAIIAVEPKTREGIRANRDFLVRVVRYLAGEGGIRQFLDIGSGIPTVQNVHDIAQDLQPGARVAYVDNDDVAIAHSKLILAGHPSTTAVLGDLRDPEGILVHPEVRQLLDFTQPVAVLIASVLHFVPEHEDPYRIVATLRDALAPGSYLAISHACRDNIPKLAENVAKVYNSRVSGQGTYRTRDQIARFFDGFTLVDPGLAWLPDWRPDTDEEIPDGPVKFWALAGVGRYD